MWVPACLTDSASRLHLRADSVVSHMPESLIPLRRPLVLLHEWVNLSRPRLLVLKTVPSTFNLVLMAFRIKRVDPLRVQKERDKKVAMGVG